MFPLMGVTNRRRAGSGDVDAPGQYQSLIDVGLERCML